MDCPLKTNFLAASPIWTILLKVRVRFKAEPTAEPENSAELEPPAEPELYAKLEPKTVEIGTLDAVKKDVRKAEKYIGKA